MGRELLLHHCYRNNYNSHHVQRYQSLITTSNGCIGHNSLYCIRKASYIPRIWLRNEKGVLVLFGFSLSFFFPVELSQQTVYKLLEESQTSKDIRKYSSSSPDYRFPLLEEQCLENSL